MAPTVWDSTAPVENVTVISDWFWKIVRKSLLVTFCGAASLSMSAAKMKKSPSNAVNVHSITSLRAPPAMLPSGLTFVSPTGE